MSADHRQSSITIPVGNILLFLYTIQVFFFIPSDLTQPFQILILDPRLGVHEAFTKVSEKIIVKFRSIYIIDSIIYICNYLYIYIPFSVRMYV